MHHYIALWSCQPLLFLFNYSRLIFHIYFTLSLIPALSTLTAHHRLPAGSVGDALSCSDIVTMAGASVGLGHGQMAVGI